MIPHVKKEVLDAIVEVCLCHGIICYSNELYRGFHQDSSNPLRFSNTLTSEQIRSLVESGHHHGIATSTPSHLTDQIDSPLIRLLSKRKSAESFGTGIVTQEQLGGLLKAMYGFNPTRPTPSAGMLYPLTVYFAKRDSQGSSRSVYRFKPETSEVDDLNISISDQELNFSFDSYQAENCDLVVFVVANLKRVATKYANRGYRYALLETGHAAQNAYLFCAEQGLGIREYGGFQDSILTTLLHLNEGEEGVLTVLLVGETKQGEPARVDLPLVAENLLKAVVGTGKPVESVIQRSLQHGEYTFRRFVATAKFHSVDIDGVLKFNPHNYSLGVSVSSHEAVIKAVAEGYERYASSLVKVDLVDSASNLSNSFFDSRISTPFSSEQEKHLALDTFEPTFTQEWVKGFRFSSNEPVFVPIDHAFYPVYPNSERRIHYRSNSSGVAAHFDVSEAKRRALYELVERDALMIIWQSKKKPTQLPTIIAGIQAKKSADFWGGKGWTVKLLDITQDSVPVVLAIIYSEAKYPAFVSGAAAADTYEVAAEKAMNEAEIMLLLALEEREQKAVAAEEVMTPMDHGRLYFAHENLWRVRWLIETEESSKLVLTNQDPFVLFDPVFVDLTPASNLTNLKVFRALSEKLVPINFGFGSEHSGHFRFDVLGLEVRQGSQSFPHFFA